jgi:hypothetical protein
LLAGPVLLEGPVLLAGLAWADGSIMLVEVLTPT